MRATRDMDLTIVFPVKNEAENLHHAIPMVRKLGRVLVVDSKSTDSTASVARELGAEVLQFDWNGRFPKKRNWVLQNYEFETDWVLFIDADEFVSEAFVKEVKKAIKNSPHVGFWLNFENYFMGKCLQHGDPMKKLALFRVGSGEYERIDECSWSHLDMEVHEHPVLQGSVGEIITPIVHNDYRGLRHYITKHNEYSEWEARRYLKLKETGRKDWDRLNKRQQFKYRNLAKWWFAPFYFLVSYLYKGGFRDGAGGLRFAVMKAIYFYQIRLKILEHEIVGSGPKMPPASTQ